MNTYHSQEPYAFQDRQQILQQWHLLDPMHIEKNVCSSLFKTLKYAKNTKVNSKLQRLKMKNIGIMKDMWIELGNAAPPTSLHFYKD